MNAFGRARSGGLLILAILSTSVCAPGCGPDAEVVTVSSPSATFAPYRTFAFGPDDAAPAGFDSTEHTTAIAREMQALVAAHLEQKGYSRAQPGHEGEADFVVRLACGSHAREAREKRDRGTGEVSLVVSPTLSGQLVVQMFDAHSSARVWRSEGKMDVDPAALDRALLRETVAEIMDPFPRRAR